ncbi:hypothetical protein Cyrtocomes_00140 [Candidatus Cyrtobacter comes]|uniref:Uncharacterized protein n=1 Tax=Candidatus Cyrtobacter comes TaxID=675776 RepID=A0ABU5L6V7_9RICK|nr:hypothetical protein [Candidatus Cyrtobacter comes]MDZ5761782.1 hypothetical protein [Candidatus Cyrtobacter comes]
MELDNAIPRAVSLYRDSSIKSKFDIPEYENEFESTAAQIISNSIKSTNGQKVLVTDEDCRNAFCNVVKAKIAELDESNISEVRHGAGKSQQKVVAEKKEMRPIEEDKDNELFINDEQLAHELQMNYIIEDSRLQYREEREAVRKLKRAEADKKAELHKQYAEISKTGVYLIENSNTIVRVLNDSHYQYDKYFGTEYNNGTEHTELIDADGGYLRAGLNIFHTGFSLAYGFYSHSVVPIVSTAVYTIKGNTDFLKSDNPYIQCFMDASTAPIAQLVTFNPYGAAITAGLGSAKCVLPESLQPVIRVAQNVNDLANSANVVIQTVEGVKFIYTMYDNFFINDEQLSESPDIHI